MWVVPTGGMEEEKEDILVLVATLVEVLQTLDGEVKA